MSAADDDYDVAIVGASTAGCTAARLYAQRGARVALIERRPPIDAYKTICTHFIQSSATPTIAKLGLAPLIEARGAVHNSIDLWTRDSGWIVPDRDEAPFGLPGKPPQKTASPGSRHSSTTASSRKTPPPTGWGR